MTQSHLPGFLEKALLAMCQETDTPRSLTVALLVRAGEWDQLACLGCDPRDYADASSYYRDVVVTDFLRKLESLPTSFDRAHAAEENFWKAERQCASANRRLAPFLYGLLDSDDEGLRDGRMHAFFSCLRKNVLAVLGPKPPTDVWGRFGPGATYADRGVFTTVPHKMSTRPTLTHDAWPFLVPWSGSAWATACATSCKSPVFVKGNRFTTVPKDCRKDRGIAVEPSMNVFFQLGAGAIVRRRLRSHANIDLNYAQDTHRRVARESSITGHLCTMDLSNASDTICINLVKLALPKSWFELLFDLRSPYTEVKGKWVRLEKFSSMGNGYTFELETLLFASIVYTVLELTGHKPVYSENVYAYGDDLIFPSECYSDVKAVLSFLGLSVNEDKTFYTGKFRESCGGDFFDGKDVRPYYQKKDPCEPQQLISLANGIRRISQKLDPVDPLVRGVRRGWFSVLDALPTHIRRLRGPETLGDLVIHDDPDHWGRTIWRDSIRYFQVYKPARFKRVGWDLFDPEVVLASATYGTGGGELGVTPRDAVLGYKVAWCPSS